MSTNAEIFIPEVDPEQAWNALKADPTTVLVDVRTIAEWDYVGEPVLDSTGKEMVKVELTEFPEMVRNSYFADEVLSQIDGAPSAIYFICRSGRRSRVAAMCIAEKLAEQGRDIPCINVAEGFEGPPDENKHRSTTSGWKLRGLPWIQQ